MFADGQDFDSHGSPPFIILLYGAGAQQHGFIFRVKLMTKPVLGMKVE
jgi:hypothetical protein